MPVIRKGTIERLQEIIDSSDKVIQAIWTDGDLGVLIYIEKDFEVRSVNDLIWKLSALFPNLTDSRMVAKVIRNLDLTEERTEGYFVSRTPSKDWIRDKQKGFHLSID